MSLLPKRFCSYLCPKLVLLLIWSCPMPSRRNILITFTFLVFIVYWQLGFYSHQYYAIPGLPSGQWVDRIQDIIDPFIPDSSYREALWPRYNSRDSLPSDVKKHLLRSDLRRWRRKRKMESVPQSTEACRMPQLEPWGSGVARFEKVPGLPPRCLGRRSKKADGLKFRIDFQNHLVRMESESNRKFWLENTCYYRSFTRAVDEPDFSISVSNTSILITTTRSKLPPGVDQIHVWCFKAPHVLVSTYQDDLSLVQEKPELEKALEAAFNSWTSKKAHAQIAQNAHSTDVTKNVETKPQEMLRQSLSISGIGGIVSQATPSGSNDGTSNAQKISGHGESEAHRNASAPEFYNVLILGQDSMSHMSFRRYMPRVHDFLLRELNAVEFSGFNSLGPGTLWSLFPLLTGLSFDEITHSCWKGEKGYLDNCPWIWEDFAARGYRTAYDDDSETQNQFAENQSKGFGRQPFHYDFRAADALRKRPNCMRLPLEVTLENLARVARTFRDKPYWALMWAHTLSHQANTMAKYAEEPFLQHLSGLQSQGLLNRTFVIMLSDHGMRYGRFRQKTRQGLLEERLPTLYISVPLEFEENYPGAIRNLRGNAGKLTTALDVWETMRDLLDLESLGDPMIATRGTHRNLLTARSVSLFLPVNPNRTCHMIGFHFIYCVCLNRASVNPNHYLVEAGARYIVRDINQRIRKSPQCHPLTLAKVTSANLLNVDVGYKDESDRFWASKARTDSAMGTQLEIEVETRPGRGTFFASVMFKGGSPSFWTRDRLKRIRPHRHVQVDSMVTRVTDYGKSGDCVADRELKPFCYCFGNRSGITAMPSTTVEVEEETETEASHGGIDIEAIQQMIRELNREG